MALRRISAAMMAPAARMISAARAIHVAGDTDDMTDSSDDGIVDCLTIELTGGALTVVTANDFGRRSVQCYATFTLDVMNTGFDDLFHHHRLNR